MRHVRDDLTAFLDGALAKERRDEVEVHLAVCPACRLERQRLAAAVAALAEAPAPPEPSPTFQARFYARLASEKSRRRGGWLGALRWRVIAPLAGVAAAAAMTTVVVLRERTDRIEMVRHLELLDEYELVASVGDVDEGDVEVVAHLDELGEGRP